MKTNPPPPAQRGYQQKARAAAAEESSRRIVTAFLKRAETEWFEQVTLDSVAKDSEVTVQTVVRKFGGKEGLLEAACNHLSEAVQVRRSLQSSDIDRAVDAVANDYEQSGKLILHLLNQEDRHPLLKPALDLGRRGHREWLAKVFSEKLNALPAAKRTARLDALVVATDLYVWKLVRVDMDRPVSAFKSIARRMVAAALGND